VQNALRKFPDDVRLILLRTSWLLRYGNVPDLLEVQLRLSGLDAYYSERLTAKDGSLQWPDDWTEKDQALLQVYCLHRAVYFHLLGNSAAATYFAAQAQKLGEITEQAAANLVRELSPSAMSPR
jgi:hypothetical protein